MDAVSVSATKGADVFVFDYSHLDVVYAVTLGAGNWGLFQADGTIAVGKTLAPQIGADGVTSQGGAFKTSISLAGLTSYTTARVHYDGQGFTLAYTLNNGTTWTTLPEDGVIVLPTNADLDLRVTFPGNIANDPAVLNSLTVYVLNSETVKTLKGSRTMTFHNDPVTTDGLVVGSTAASIAIATPGDADYTIGTIEMWVTPTTTSVFTSPPAGTMYKNGVAGSPTSGVREHIVLVLTTPANTAFSLAANATYSHLAVYPQAMNATDVANLYAAQTGVQKITVDDNSTISVTESSPATDIYAYAWQIQSGGS